MAIEETTLEPEACTSRSNCGSTPHSLRGGLLIDGPDHPPCTTGFLARNANNTPVFLTAGHCGGFTAVGVDDPVTIGGTQTGVYAYNSFQAAADNGYPGYVIGDTASVAVSTSANVTNIIYKSAGTKAWRITSRDTVGHVPWGARVCMATRLHYYRCGYARATITKQVFGVEVRGLVLWEFSHPGNREGVNFGGSSGGPVFRDRMALGVHQSSSTGHYNSLQNVTPMHGAFTKIRWAEQELSVTVQTTP